MECTRTLYENTYFLTSTVENHDHERYLAWLINYLTFYGKGVFYKHAEMKNTPIINEVVSRKRYERLIKIVKTRQNMYHSEKRNVGPVWVSITRVTFWNNPYSVSRIHENRCQDKRPLIKPRKLTVIIWVTQNRPFFFIPRLVMRRSRVN